MTALVLNARSKVGLNTQSPHIQSLLRRTNFKVRGDALFINAFPDVGESIKYARDALSKCSKNIPGLEEVHQRIKTDQGYADQLAFVVRFSFFVAKVCYSYDINALAKRSFRDLAWGV